MRDPRDVLADIFFSRRSLVAILAATLVGASAFGLASCQPATPEGAPTTSPAAAPPVDKASLRVVKLHGQGFSQEVWIATMPDTGCEYLFISNSGGLTPHVGRHSNGGYVHMGCRLGTTGY